MRLPYKGRCRITKLFGTKPPAGVHYKYGYHTGCDLVGITDKTIVSCEAGQVTANGYDAHGWGNYVKIKGAESGLTAIYCHMAARSALAVGKLVAAGTVIGREGATGQVTGGHLHLEFRKKTGDGSTAANPCTLLGIVGQTGEVEEVEEEMEITKVKFILPDKTKIAVDGFLSDGVNYTAARKLLEALGFKVGWDGTNVLVSK